MLLHLAYPLGALDSIFPDGSTNWGSAMMIILAGKKEEHLNMLEGGIIAKLLEEKWTTFASMFFIKRLVITIIHLICIRIAIYFRPDKVSDHFLYIYMRKAPYVHHHNSLLITNHS